MKNLLSTLTAASAVLLLTGCPHDEEGDKPRAETIRSVKTEVAKTRSVRQLRRFPAVLEPPQLVPLAFEVGGRLSGVNLRVGQEVTTGELLATVEPVELQLQLRQARAALFEAETAASNADAEMKRQVELFKQKVVSAVARDKAVVQAKQAEARRAQAQGNVDIIKERLADTELRAPFNGVINAVDVQSFASVKAGQPALTLYRKDELQASILVSFDVAEALELGRAVKVVPAAGIAEPIGARITEIGQRAPAVSAFPVIVKLEKAPVRLRSGMAVEVEIEMDAARGVGLIALPLSAIATHRIVSLKGDPPYSAEVFVFKPGKERVGALALRKIAIMAPIENRVFVSDGIAPGEIVVTGGVPFLRDGQKVRLTEAAATASSETGR